MNNLTKLVVKMPREDHGGLEWNLHHMLRRHKMNVVIFVARHCDTLAYWDFVFFGTKLFGEMADVVSALC